MKANVSKWNDQLQILSERRTRQTTGNRTSEIDDWRKIDAKSFKELHDFVVVMPN